MKFVSLHLLTSFSLLLLPIVFPKLLVPIARAETQVTVTQTDAALLLDEGDRLLDESFQLWRAGQFQQGFELLLHALDLYRDPDARTTFPEESRRGEQLALIGLGTVSASMNQYSQALDYYEQSLFISQEIGDRHSEGSTLSSIGEVYQSLEQYQAALSVFQQSLAIAQDIGELSGEGITLANIGSAYDNLGDYQNALTFYEQSLDIFQTIGNPAGEGIILNNIGSVYDGLGNYQRALAFYEQSLTIQQDMGDRARKGTTLNNIGLVYANLGDYQAALDSYEQSLGIAQELNDRAGEGITLNNIGSVYDRLGDYQRALAFYEQSLTIKQEMGDRRGEGTTLNNIGLVYTNIGDYERALDNYEQSLTIFQSIGDRAGEGITLNNIGGVYNRLGRYETALSSYEQSLAISQAMGDRAGESATLGNIGSVYDRLGDAQNALATYEQSLAISQDIGDRLGVGRTLNSIGLVYARLGDPINALTAHEQSLAISQEIGDRMGEGRAFNNIGTLYDRLGDHKNALETFQQSLAIRRAIGDRSGESVTLNNIGATYTRLGDDERALSVYQQSLAIAQDINDRSGESTTLNNIGLLLAAMGEPELAIIILKQSVNQWEAIRGDIRGLDTELQQSFTDRISGSYRRLADLLLQADRVLEAQRVLDLLRVQELDEYLQDVQRTDQTEARTPLRPIEQEAWQRYEANQARLIALGQELRELEAISRSDRTTAQQERVAELRQLQQDSRTVFQSFINSAEIQAIVAQLRTTTGAANVELAELNALQDNLRQLEQTTVTLYPLVLEDRLELVLVTPNAPPIRRTVAVGREDLNRAIVEFRSALQSRGDVETPAQQLYDWLLRPLEADLAQADTEVILYSPDGQLRYIPLAALHDGNQWVAQQWQVNNIIAASLTDLNNQSFEAGFSILAAAFTEGQYDIPISTRTLSFWGLQFAGREVENLAQLIPGTDQRLNQDFDQSIVLEMNDFNIIHLATHATFNPGPEEDSFILFGDGSRASLEAIRSWNFPDVELIVLSACETAVGDVPLGNGAEVLGLGYLMQQAGAEAAIASLWQVSDGGTQVLMDAFYAALNNGYSKAEALQRAQIALITSDETVLEGDRGNATINIIDTRTGQPLERSTDLAHPYYWAPFILIGNGL